MVDLNGLPQTTIRHDPWQRANMMGQVVHCGYHYTGVEGPSFYIENEGSVPLVLALSAWGSVAYDLTFYTACSFTGSAEANQYLVNRYAQAAHGFDMDKVVSSPLVAYTAGASFSGDAAMVWSAAAGSRLTPFGPNSFTGVSIVLDATEKVRVGIARTDGETDSQEWNLDLTWTGWDFNLLTITPEIEEA